jgi:hypothetical protein
LKTFRGKSKFEKEEHCLTLVTSPLKAFQTAVIAVYGTSHEILSRVVLPGREEKLRDDDRISRIAREA